MRELNLEKSEYDALFGKKNYEFRDGKIFVFKNNDIYNNSHHKWLRVDDAVLKTGHKICVNGKIGFYNEISVLRSKIENKIPFLNDYEA